jgi:HSP20 family protein
MGKTNESSTAVARRPESGITRFSPWEELTELRHRMDDLFARAFGYTPLSRLIPGEVVEFEPQVDIHENEDQILAFASIPGFEAKQINVETAPESLTITGEREALYDDEKAMVHRVSGLSGKCSFRFYTTLPTEIDPNKVKATFHNGILKLEMPKTERARTKTVKVNVQAV